MSQQHEPPRKIGLSERVQRDIKVIMQLRQEAAQEAGKPYTAQIISMLRGYAEGAGVNLDVYNYHISDDLTHLLVSEIKSPEAEREAIREAIREAAKELN